MKYVFFAVWLTMAAMIASNVWGQASARSVQNYPRDAGPTTVKLLLRPAAESREALKHRLLPGLMDRTPGNAALLYGRIVVQFVDAGRGETFEKASKWLETPLAEFPRDEVKKYLERFQPVLKELDLAARRERCDWELPIRELGFAMSLPELAKMRDLGQLLALQARVQIAEGRIDGAIHTLQTGYALARHVAKAPTLIHGLVGIAICRQMSARLQELIAQPGAPNLYWALTMLPQPLVDLRPAVEFETNMLSLSFPALQGIDPDRHDLAYWQRLLDKLEDDFKRTLGTRPPKLGWRAPLTLLAIKLYPTAKRQLIEHGRSPAEVEAMPVPEVVIVAALQAYNEYRDRMLKWLYVPYWEARAGMEDAERSLAKDGCNRHFILLLMLLPRVEAIHMGSARNDRSIALLRTIEGLRLHAAAHGGELAATLSAVNVVPLPLDPMTGQRFLYEKSGQTAVLVLPGRSPQDSGVRVEITMQRAEK
jgi:hypothetical protein